MSYGSLGSLSGNILHVPLGEVAKSWAVTNPLPVVPAACWDKPNFKACQSWAIASPNADCQALAKQGDWSDQSLKNCIEDKYNYRMTTYCIGSCASGTVTWPGAASAAAAPSALTTLQLQQAVNLLLRPQGYVALVEDGVLGAKTCGATKAFLPEKVPAGCSSKGFTAPVKAGAYVATTVVKPIVTVKPVTTSTTTSVTTASMFSNMKWIVGGSIAIAVGLMGVAIAQKKGWIKAQEPLKRTGR
jgi:hypothetical protein